MRERERERETAVPKVLGQHGCGMTVVPPKAARRRRRHAAEGGAPTAVPPKAAAGRERHGKRRRQTAPQRVQTRPEREQTAVCEGGRQPDMTGRAARTPPNDPVGGMDAAGEAASAAVPGASRRAAVHGGTAVGAPGPVLRDRATRLRRGMEAAGSGAKPQRVRRAAIGMTRYSAA